jgi:hypothetical protein
VQGRLSKSKKCSAIIYVYLGAVNYLRSVIALEPAAVAAMDTAIKAAARLMSGLPYGCSNALLWTHGGTLTADGVIAREMARLRLQQQLTPFQDAYAARQYAALEAEPRSRATCSGRYANSAHAAARPRDRRLQRGDAPGAHMLLGQ